MKATLSHFHQSPRKVRLVANMIRGKSAEHARRVLDFADQKTAPTIKKLIESALANAKNKGLDTSNLIVKEIQVGKGLHMRRFIAKSRGRGFPFRKQTSHIFITLGEKAASTKKGKPERKVKTRADKKTAQTK